MFDAWDLRIFDNIAAAEQTHTTAVLTLLEGYRLPDPAAGLAPGEFSNADLQALYDELVETGSRSVTDAADLFAEDGEKREKAQAHTPGRSSSVVWWAWMDPARWT